MFLTSCNIVRKKCVSWSSGVPVITRVLTDCLSNNLLHAQLLALTTLLRNVSWLQVFTGAQYITTLASWDHIASNKSCGEGLWVISVACQKYVWLTYELHLQISYITVLPRHAANRRVCAKLCRHSKYLQHDIIK